MGNPHRHFTVISINRTLSYDLWTLTLIGQVTRQLSDWLIANSSKAGQFSVSRTLPTIRFICSWTKVRDTTIRNCLATALVLVGFPETPSFTGRVKVSYLVSNWSLWPQKQLWSEWKAGKSPDSKWRPFSNMAAIEKCEFSYAPVEMLLSD